MAWNPVGDTGPTILYNVLVVDDDEEMRTATIAALRSRPMLRVVGHAGTARAAIGRARSIELDLIVLDDRLGVGPRGLEIAPSLHRLAKFAYVVLFTAHPPEAPVEELEGIDAIVVKPNFELLVDKCANFLSGEVDVDLTNEELTETTSPEQA